MPASHPHLEDLKRYALGRLDSEDDIAISKHLAECRQCLSTLDKLQREIYTIRKSRAEALALLDESRLPDEG